MTHEPLRVEPVQVEYYEDKDSATLRVMRFVALIAIIYGASNVLSASLQVAGVAMGHEWFRHTPAIYTLQSLAALVLSVVLVLSGIGCLSYRPLARKGMLLFSIVTLALTAFMVGVNTLAGLRSARGGPSSFGMLSALVGYAGGAVHGAVFPAIMLMVFRLKEVERAFDERLERSPSAAMTKVPR